MKNEIIATMQYNGKGFDLIYDGKSIYTVKDGDTLNYYVPGDNPVSTSVIKFNNNDWCLGDRHGAALNGIQVIWTIDNRSHKMYESIIRGLHDAIDDVVDRSKYDRIDLDGLMFNEVPLSAEDSFVDIGSIDWNDTGSDNNE